MTTMDVEKKTTENHVLFFTAISIDTSKSLSYDKYRFNPWISWSMKIVLIRMS